MYNILLVILLSTSTIGSSTPMFPASLPNEMIQHFWHGKSFTNSKSDALGRSLSTFQFSDDGKTGEYITSGNVGNREYRDRNKFRIVSSNSESITIEYTWTSDSSMSQYIVGKKETITLNATDKTITHAGKTYR